MMQEEHVSEVYGFALFGLDMPSALPCLVFWYAWHGWWRGYPAFHVAYGAISSSPRRVYQRECTSFTCQEAVQWQAELTTLNDNPCVGLSYSLIRTGRYLKNRWRCFAGTDFCGMRSLRACCAQRHVHRRWQIAAGHRACCCTVLEVRRRALPACDHCTEQETLVLVCKERWTKPHWRSTKVSWLARLQATKGTTYRKSVKLAQLMEMVINMV
jgi:hypothetical protein